MTERTLRQVLKFIGEHAPCNPITIGGGEPTCHPKFWEFYGIILGEVGRMDLFDDYGPGVIGLVTNGKKTKDALALANLAKHGIIWCALSQDQWHDPVDPKVVRAFTKKPRPWAADPNWYPMTQQEERDLREIRTVFNVTDHGRASENSLASGRAKECCCDSAFVFDPDGTIFTCGCREATYGTVWEPEIPEGFDPHEDMWCPRSGKPKPGSPEWVADLVEA